MRLSPFLTITGLLAITQFTGTFGVPVNEDVVLSPRSENGGLAKRTPTIPMTRVATNTWQGTMPPNIFSPTLTNKQIKDYAVATYNDLITKTDSVVMVAVIWVPGAGLAAGTIWHGLDPDFENNYLNLATTTRSLVAGQGYSSFVANWQNAPSKWHAEIVAAQKAEVAYGARMTAANRWPSGTKICVYGKKQRNGELKYWPPCSSGSTASIPCTNVVLRDLDMTAIV